MTEPPIALEDRQDRDGRLFSPSAGRNKAVIAAALAETIRPNASILEVGSGTGEHAIEVLSLRPDLRWQYSDPDAASRESQLAWRDYKGLDLNPPIHLDVSDINSRARVASSYDVIFSANMIHIAPVSALEGLADLAHQVLDETGKICLYGPFLFGSDSAPSNLKFDISLKQRNSSWGVREIEFVKHIFAKRSFNTFSLRGMPKNNFMLLVSKN